MILDEIARRTRSRVAEAKARRSLGELRQEALAKTGAEKKAGPGEPEFPFEKALSAPGLSFICEVKRASPSRGLIAGDFPYLEIARDYEAAGAAAISVLTEPDYFLGCDEYLREIAGAVKIPVLRKDFIVDPYQIYEAKLLGASAVLLICALLDTETLASCIGLTHGLGLSALVEIHREEELAQALAAGARIIGINNRNLKTFRVDPSVTGRLRKLVPSDRLVVSESGIQSPADIRALEEQGVHGALIGETLMRAADKRGRLAELRGITKIKICGLFRDEDIDFANEAGPDYIGFVFAPSPRRVSAPRAERLRGRLAEGIIPVGVFVNAPADEIIALYEGGIIAMAQLHGGEDGAYIAALRARSAVPVIRALRIETKDDIALGEPDQGSRQGAGGVAGAPDFFLLDHGAGGTGRAFDWTLLKDISGPGVFRSSCFLAGGIDMHNIEEALSYRPYGIDVSGGAETRGLKDRDKMIRLVQKVRGEELGR
jgi:indole-3-glycerol phosphate synthase/phosphoribosylanthranilate isomerase